MCLGKIVSSQECHACFKESEASHLALLRMTCQSWRPNLYDSCCLMSSREPQKTIRKKRSSWTMRKGEGAPDAKGKRKGTTTNMKASKRESFQKFLEVSKEIQSKEKSRRLSASCSKSNMWFIMNFKIQCHMARCFAWLERAKRPARQSPSAP